MGKSPTKESAYPKREMDTHRLQKLDIDYTVYIKTTNVRLTHYKVY